jgi:hypothetical protein
VLPRPGDAVPEAHADAELLDLYRAMRRAEARYTTAEVHADRVQGEAYVQQPAPPREARREMFGKWCAMTREELAQFWPDDPGEQARRLAALERYQAACRAIEEQLGLPALRAQAEMLERTFTPARAAFTAAPARTALGLLLKLRLAAEYEAFGEDEGEDGYVGPKLMGALTRDLEHLARAQAGGDPALLRLLEALA